MFASIAESFAILLVALTFANTGDGAIVLPGIAMVVGLHFLPMAYGNPFRAFYPLGSGLVAPAVVGALIRQPLGTIVVGFVGASFLWAASMLALVRARAMIVQR